MNDAAKHTVPLLSAGIAFNPGPGQIQASGQTLSLSPVNMKVLMVLLDNAGKVVSRAAIYEQVWGNQIVSDDALTRCISDLRILLKTVCNDALIETLPKRGYRWLADVRHATDSSPSTQHAPPEEMTEAPIDVKKEAVQETIKPARPFLKPFWFWLVAGIVIFFILFSVLLVYPGRLQDPGYIQLALMPVQVSNQEQQGLGAELEDELRKQLLNTEKLRFLSRNGMNSFQEAPYARLFNELGTQWVIEVQVRQRQDNILMSLSLVDARTSLVTYMESASFREDDAALESLCSTFISGISELLGLAESSGKPVGTATP